jgi:hypothetical protein
MQPRAVAVVEADGKRVEVHEVRKMTLNASGHRGERITPILMGF